MPELGGKTILAVFILGMVGMIQMGIILAPIPIETKQALYIPMQPVGALLGVVVYATYRKYFGGDV